MANDDELLKRLERIAHDFDVGQAESDAAFAAATRIRELTAELAFYRGFHDGVCNTGTHVIVPVEPNATLLKAMEDARWGTPNWRHTTAYDAYKAMIKAAKEGGWSDAHGR